MGTIGIQRSFGFATFQFRLAKFGSLGGVGTGLQGRFLQEVAPAFVAVGRTLFGFEVLQGRLRVLPSFDDFDHSCGFVGTDVVPDYNVRCLQFVVCQMVSLVQPQPRPTVRLSARAMISKLIGVSVRAGESFRATKLRRG